MPVPAPGRFPTPAPEPIPCPDPMPVPLPGRLGNVEGRDPIDEPPEPTPGRFPAPMLLFPTFGRDPAPVLGRVLGMDGRDAGVDGRAAGVDGLDAGRLNDGELPTDGRAPPEKPPLGRAPPLNPPPPPPTRPPPPPPRPPPPPPRPPPPRLKAKSGVLITMAMMTASNVIQSRVFIGISPVVNLTIECNCSTSRLIRVHRRSQMRSGRDSDLTDCLLLQGSGRTTDDAYH